MKFLEIVFILIMVNLTVTLFASANMLPGTTMVFNTSLEQGFDSTNGQPTDPNSMSYKIVKFTQNTSYLNEGTQDPTARQILLGGDFVRGLFWFVDTMSTGTLLVYPTLQMFGVPSAIIYYIVIPVYFLYAIALIQLVSGRSFAVSE